MKDHTREYATAAYRFYAYTGGYKKYINELLGDLKRQKGIGTVSPTEGALICKERILEERSAELADLEAVERSIHIIETLENGRDILQAVEMVYFKDCQRDIKRGEIQERVHYAEIHIPASERQIYYWLNKARKIFANERGLRV